MSLKGTLNQKKDLKRLLFQLASNRGCKPLGSSLRPLLNNRRSVAGTPVVPIATLRLARLTECSICVSSSFDGVFVMPLLFHPSREDDIWRIRFFCICFAPRNPIASTDVSQGVFRRRQRY